MNDILQFKSGTGKKYFYDQQINMFLPLQEYHSTYHKTIKKQYALPRSELLPPTERRIKNHLLQIGLAELTLGITERCNLRCKYCAYSENYYPERRKHSKIDMDFKVARKAIDNYIKMIMRSRQYYNPYRRPTIGFYGGEPLLKFDLIKSCAEYIQSLYSGMNVYYTITTNGTLLTKDRVEYLLSNGFQAINISLDGPERIHDRNRVFPNGNGSFNKIMDNIKSLPDKYKEKLFSIATYDWKTDFNLCDEFFRKADVPKPLRVNSVEREGGYYKQFSREDYNNYIENITKVKDTYRKRMKNLEQGKEIKSAKGQKQGPQIGYLDSMLLKNPIFLIMGQARSYRGKTFFPFTGACVPGSNIYVDPKGKYHLCEKVPNNFQTIGDIYQGLDYSAIKDVINKYQEIISKACLNCPIRHLCPTCEKVALQGNSSSFRYCDPDKKIKELKGVLSYTFSFMEETPELFRGLLQAYKHLRETVPKRCS